MNRLYLLFVVLVFAHNISEAGTSYDSTFSSVLDKTLSNSNFSNSDIWIPQDFHPELLYLPTAINNLHKQPLKSGLFADTIINELSSNIKTLNSELFTKLTILNSFKKFSLIEYDDFLANDILNRYLGLDIDSAYGFPASLIIKQYLIPILKANFNLEKDVIYSSKSEIKFIKKHADSIFFRNDIPKSNPYIFNNFLELNKSNAKSFFKNSEIAGNTNLYNIGLSLYLHYLKLNQLTISNMKDLSAQIKTKIIETNIGRIAFGGISNDNYSGDFILIIDLGGNDTYNFPDFSKQLSLITPIRFVADFAGNDNYSGGDNTFGGAYFGINLHYDYTGDDSYTAANTSLGAANFGVGILHDFSGDDNYKGKNLSQGASAFGIGILLDDSGNDTYNSESFAQGFAFTNGMGLLIDRTGNDKYLTKGNYSNSYSLSQDALSFSQGATLGYYPLAAGGFGLLMDLAGADAYTSGSFSQGASYFYGYGALCDKSGDDKYVGNSYSQGCGFEFAFGNLVDYSGNDNYDAKSLSQAYGTDFGSGNLIDFGGDDKYSNLSLDPDHTSGNSISFFADYRGNNSFSKVPKSIIQGCSNPIDILFNYADIKLIVNSDSLSLNNNHFADLNYHCRADFRLILPADISGKNLTQQDLILKIPSSADSLFILSTTYLSAFKKYSFASRDSLALKGLKGIETLQKNINSDNPQSTRTINYVLNKMLETDSLGTNDYILDSLNSKSPHTFEIFSRILSKKYPLESKNFILFRLLDNDWRIRSLAIQALSNYDGLVIADNLSQLLSDKNKIARARAAAYLGMMKFDNYLENILPAFIDKSSIVRQSAYKGIFSNLSTDISFIKNSLNLSLPLNMKLMLIEEIVGMDVKEKEIKELSNLILEQDVQFRKAFYLAIISEKKSKWHKKISTFIKNENDSELKNILKNE